MFSTTDSRAKSKRSQSPWSGHPAGSGPGPAAEQPLDRCGPMVAGIAVAALSLALGACGGGGEEQSAPRPQTASAPAAEATPSTPASKPAPGPVKDITYRQVEATLRSSGEKITIQVPDDVDFETGRMIEIREGADGKYYFVSLIPN